MTTKSLDYGSQYDEYWSKPDRVGETSCDLSSVADLVVLTCGVGGTLDVGSGEGYLVGELLRRGVDAHGIDVSKIVVDRCEARWPGRFQVGSVLDLPYGDQQFQTLVSIDCMEHLSKLDIKRALQEMYRVSSRFVFLQLATTQDRDAHWHLTVEGREWWEERCFEAGFRKHPAYYDANPYEALNVDPAQIYVLLEKVPRTAFDEQLMQSLDGERLLHRDMLRETGRRSDAHCVRYFAASQYVRPGDVVLDVACGLGYGSHILYYNSQARSVLGVDLSRKSVAYAQANFGIPDNMEFRIGDAQRLEFIEDNSVDFIAAFETIEHLPKPDEYLRELRRILKPAGRVCICAPNNWADETGKDPNPHHLQVYTWDRLKGECGQQFLIEKGFLQTAGGAMKCHHSPRSWQEVDPSGRPDEESEWILFLCMKDPLLGRGVPYAETVWELPSSPDFNVSAFGRDYLNPWLVKGMVAIAYRSRSAKVLRQIQQSVIDRFPRETADYGAALCGLVYGKLGQAHLDAKEYEWLIGLIRDYAGIVEPAPHQLRWQVSLLFVAGELARCRGEFADAKSMYEECSAKDVMAFSPLLGNRVLDALHWLTVLAIGEGEFDAARSYLLRAVRECHRLSAGSWLNISGDDDHPLAFGFAEMAQLMDKGSRAAYMLGELDGYVARPKAMLAQAAGFLERQLLGMARERTNLNATVSTLSDKVAEKERVVQRFAQEVTERERYAQELGREVARQDAHAQELAREVTRIDAHAQALARELVEKDAQQQRYKDSICELERHSRELAIRSADQEEMIRRLTAELEKERNKSLFVYLRQKCFFGKK